MRHFALAAASVTIVTKKCHEPTLVRANGYLRGVTPDTELACIEVGRVLMRYGYRFTTCTPTTHQRVVARARARTATSLRDIFGWNVPFDFATLPTELRTLLGGTELVDEADGVFKSKIRFSSLAGHLFAHSAFPTTQRDAVFFGPDTYRFVRLLERHIGEVRRVVDVGCGSGAGGIAIAHRAKRVVLSDINDKALSFARVNVELAGLTAKTEIVLSDVLEGVLGEYDAVISNPPYIVDSDKRAYRDGGGEHGIDLTVRIARESLERLDARGRLVLYSGAPMVDDVDLLKNALVRVAEQGSHRASYEELDPDVFGEELDEPAYNDVERIAAIGFVVDKL